jgi:hypothetical protein
MYMYTGLPGKDGEEGPKGKDAPKPECKLNCHHGAHLHPDDRRGHLNEVECKCDCIKGFSGDTCDDCEFDGVRGRVVVGVCRPTVHAEGIHGGEADGIHGDEAHGIHGAAAMSRANLAMAPQSIHTHKRRASSAERAVKIAHHLKVLIKKLKPEVVQHLAKAASTSPRASRTRMLPPRHPRARQGREVMTPGEKTPTH